MTRMENVEIAVDEDQRVIALQPGFQDLGEFPQSRHGQVSPNAAEAARFTRARRAQAGTAAMPSRPRIVHDMTNDYRPANVRK
jgi:hypothetical protein